MNRVRVRRLRAALDDLVADAPPPSSAAGDTDADAWTLALEAFRASWMLEHAVARDTAERAAAALAGEPNDAATRVLVAASLGLAAAGLGVTGDWTRIAPGACASGDPITDALPAVVALADVPGDDAVFARYALAEAALALGRVALADRIGAGSLRGELAGHPFELVIVVLRSRIAVFAGRVADALELLREVPADAPEPLALLAEATRTLATGNAADPAETRSIAARVGARRDARTDRIGSGTALLGAYGLIALGDVPRSAALLIGSGWERSMIIDRAISHELLAHAALDTGDLAAAEAWLAGAEESFAGDVIADSTLERTRSRILLLLGDPEGAIEAAERAISRALEEGRVVEAAEGEVLAARARIVAGRRGEAARRLERLVAGADPVGFRAARLSAARELRRTGRRLPPTRGAGRVVLSPREVEVLDLLTEGCETAEIAADLHISLHTTRIHVARILSAYGAPSRIALAPILAAERGTAATPGDWEALTPRQRAVVAEAATGAGTDDIAARLHVASRTVEKHLTEAMRRWGSRRAWASRCAPPGSCPRGNKPRPHCPACPRRQEDAGCADSSRPARPASARRARPRGMRDGRAEGHLRRRFGLGGVVRRCDDRRLGALHGPAARDQSGPRGRASG